MKVIRTITVEASIKDGLRILLPDGKRDFRITDLREHLWTASDGKCRYRVDVLGPIVTKAGADHAGRELGCESYYPGADGTLRAAWGAGDLFPAEFAHLVHGRAGLEALA